MAANSSVEQCLAIIRELENTVVNAKRYLISADQCVVEREHLLARIRQLDTALPGAVKVAAEYAKNIDAIQQQTDQECTARLREATQKATSTVADAEAKAAAAKTEAERSAQETIQQAQAQANQLVEAARQEAARVQEEAMRRANALVSREEIVRRAHVEASETQERTQAEMAQLRSATFDYLDQIIGQADRHLSDLLTDLRNEHADLNSHR